MWTRRELKYNGKRAVLRNFWAAVAVCFLLAFIGAEYAGSVEFIHHNEDNTSNFELVHNAVTGAPELEKKGDATLTQWERFVGGLFVLASGLVLLFTFLVCHPVEVGARHFFLHNRIERPYLSGGRCCLWRWLLRRGLSFSPYPG